MRAAGQALDIQRRRGGQHAEALAEQVQGEAGARTVPRGDVAKHRGLVHLRLVDQGEVVGAAGPRRRRVLDRRSRLAERGEAGFQPDHEARHQVGAVQPQGAQGVEVFGFDARVAGMVREPEQLLFQFAEHQLQLPFQFVRRDVHDVVEDHPDPPRHGGSGEPLRCLCARGWSGWCHSPQHAEG